MTATAEATKTTGLNLHELMSQVDLSTHQFTNHGPVAPNETVVGKLDEHMRRLSVVRERLLVAPRDLGKRIEALEAEHDALHESGRATGLDCMEHHLRIDGLNAQGQEDLAVYKAVTRIFWEMLRLQFPETRGPVTIGLRDEDTVVFSEEEDGFGEGSLDDLLARILR